MRIVVACLALIVLPLTAVFAEVDDQTIVKGIDLTHRLQFDKAIALFDGLIKDDPGDPKAYFFKAEVFFWLYLLTDFDEQYGEAFRENSELTIETAKEKLKSNEDDQNSLLYLGRAYANLGRYHVVNNHYIKAYWASRKGKKTLQALIEEDPACYDAYLELGLYYYYMDVAKVLKLFSLLLGIEADRFLGLEYLQLSAVKGPLTRLDAYFFLEDIYQKYEEDPEKARGFGEELAVRYPSNPLFLSKLASSYRQLGLFDQAISLYETILEADDDPRFSKLRRSARYQIGKCYSSLNRFDAAISVFEGIVADACEKSERADHWTYPWSIYQIGHCSELEGKRNAALARYRQIKKDPDPSCYEAAQTRIEEPLTEFDRAMERAGNLLAQTKYDQALGSYSQVLVKIDAGAEGFPPANRAQVDFWIARTYQIRGDCTEAVIAFRRVLSSSASSPDWLKPWADYRAGNCYAKLGDRSQAEKHFDAASKFRDKLLRARISRDREDLERTATSAAAPVAAP